MAASERPSPAAGPEAGETSENDSDISPGVNADRTLPTLKTTCSPDQALDRLDRLARRGKLPGYEPAADRLGFEVDAFGQPFDQTIVARFDEPDDDGRRTVTLRAKVRPKTPTIFAVAIALTIWPGVALTDALIPASWGWWPTWWWYMPLVIVPTALMLPRMWSRSNAAAMEHAREQIEKIAKTLDAEVLSQQ